MQEIDQDLLSYCLLNAIKLTKQQTLILSMISSALIPVTANDVLTQLKLLNPKANRMTIHRALESLLKFGLIHRLAFNHSYILCNHLSQHNCQILVCQKCGRQTELHSHKIHQSLLDAAEKNNFLIAYPLEITGYCRSCRE